MLELSMNRLVVKYILYEAYLKYLNIRATRQDDSLFSVLFNLIIVLRVTRYDVEEDARQLTKSSYHILLIVNVKRQ